MGVDAGWGCNRPNYLSWGAGNDQVFYCMRPTAECNRTLGHSQHRRINSLVYCIHTHYMINNIYCYMINNIYYYMINNIYYYMINNIYYYMINNIYYYMINNIFYYMINNIYTIIIYCLSYNSIYCCLSYNSIYCLSYNSIYCLWRTTFERIFNFRCATFERILPVVYLGRHF
jgi:hypothetical protein